MNQVSCGNCQNPLQYPPELAGKKIRCPKCKEILALPAVTSPAAPSQPTPAQPRPAQPRPVQQQPAPTKPQQTVPQQPVKQRTVTPQPNRQQPVTPQPASPQPQAVAPQPMNPQPVAPQPVNPQPAPIQAMPNPQSPQPLQQPQPMAPNPASPQQPVPLAGNDPFGQPMAPLDAGNDPFAAQPGTPQPQPFGQPMPMAQPGMPQPLGQPQPLAQPGMPQPLAQPGMPQPMAQPGMGQPMAFQQQPAWQQQQPKKKKGNNKALKQGLIWGGVGTGVITLVVLLLVFQPWNMFGGPTGTFNRLRNAMLNENYVVMYDLMTEDAKKKWDDNMDKMINSPLASMSGNEELNELKNLSGRQRFKKMIEIGKSKGAGAPEMTDDQKYELRNSRVSKVEYSDDGKTATLTIETKQKDGETKSDKMRLVKDSGGWKLPGGPTGPRFF